MKDAGLPHLLDNRQNGLATYYLKNNLDHLTAVYKKENLNGILYKVWNAV